MSPNTSQSAVSAREDRLLAFALDFLLLTFATALIWFAFSLVRVLVGAGTAFGAAALSGSASAGSSQAMGSAGAMVGSMILSWGIGVVQWAVIGLVLTAYFTLLVERDGQTLGMRATDVTVRAADGTACTRSQALRRTAVLLAPLPLMALSSVFIPIVGLPLALFVMVGWLVVEAVLIFTDDSAQRLGDRFADTVVVEASA